MTRIRWSPNIAINRYSPGYEREQFTLSDASGMQYYSGAHVRVFFDDIHIEEIDSIGFQRAQNIRPVYGYHSTLWNRLQFGTKLVQGYFQIHLTDSAYLEVILRELEAGIAKRVGNEQPKSLIVDNQISSGGETPQLGRTVSEAVRSFSGTTYVDYEKLADLYDIAQFGYPISDRIQQQTQFSFGKLENEFSFNKSLSYLRSYGFTMTIAYGDIDEDILKMLLYNKKFNNPIANEVTNAIQGTVKQMHEVHIVAGPNQQIENDGKPVAELYTWLAKDVT